jgi:formimidoylglutamate deiminase
VCPTTEANLGDGFAPVQELCERGIGICIGSDSNVRIDPLEELRELEGIARRRAGKRNVVSVSTLLSFGADEGGAALSLERWPDAVVNLEHESLAGVDDTYSGLVLGCSAEVLRPIPVGEPRDLRRWRARWAARLRPPGSGRPG